MRLDLRSWTHSIRVSVTDSFLVVRYPVRSFKVSVWPDCGRSGRQPQGTLQNPVRCIGIIGRKITTTNDHD